MEPVSDASVAVVFITNLYLGKLTSVILRISIFPSGQQQNDQHCQFVASYKIMHKSIAIRKQGQLLS